MFLDRLFFILLLIFLPSQVGKHFFFDFSLIQGIRVDYLAPTIYFTDILFIFLICFWLLRVKNEAVFFVKKISRYKKYLFIAIFFLLINLLITKNKEIATVKLIKLFELGLLALYITYEKIPFKSVINCLLIGAIYSSLLGIFQFFKQASLGGLWWYLGERTFTIQTPGIAKAVIFGNLYLRPYATFPHPNVLAGFLAIVLPFLPIYLSKTSNSQERLFIQFMSILFLIALLLTFSRIAITIGILGFLITTILIGLKGKIKTGQVAAQLLILLFSLLILGNMLIGRFSSLFKGTEGTIYQRKELYFASLTIFKNNPIFGVGLNNFIATLPHVSYYSRNHGFYQPVHNTFLLILSEVGIIGLLAFIFLLFKTLKKILTNDSFWKLPFLVVYTEGLIFLLFDHYFYTLQQGQLLFIVLISFMIKGKIKDEQNTDNI